MTDGILMTDRDRQTKGRHSITDKRPNITEERERQTNIAMNTIISVKYI